MKQIKQGNKLLFLNDDGIVIKVQSRNDEPTLTDQTQKDQCDINNIMKKYLGKIHLVPTPTQGKYGDFSQLPSYQQSLHIIKEAQDSFNSLPAQVRKKFSNNPSEMIQFLEDETNNEEAYKLGLKIKPEIKQPTEAEIYYANQNAITKATKQKQKQKTDSDD